MVVLLYLLSGHYLTEFTAVVVSTKGLPHTLLRFEILRLDGVQLAWCCR